MKHIEMQYNYAIELNNHTYRNDYTDAHAIIMFTFNKPCWGHH